MKARVVLALAAFLFSIALVALSQLVWAAGGSASAASSPPGQREQPQMSFGVGGAECGASVDFAAGDGEFFGDFTNHVGNGAMGIGPYIDDSQSEGEWRGPWVQFNDDTVYGWGLTFNNTPAWGDDTVGYYKQVSGGTVWYGAEWSDDGITTTTYSELFDFLDLGATTFPAMHLDDAVLYGQYIRIVIGSTGAADGSGQGIAIPNTLRLSFNCEPTATPTETPTETATPCPGECPTETPTETPAPEETETPTVHPDYMTYDQGERLIASADDTLRLVFMGSVLSAGMLVALVLGFHVVRR